MTTTAENAEDIVKRGFHKVYCDVCQKQTWHYKSADNAPASCGNHSVYNGKRHATVGVMMLADFSKRIDSPTERELRIANRLDTRMWRHAEERRSSVCISDEPWAKHLFAEAPVAVKDPDKLYCTFCGNEVQQISKLTEKKPVIRKITETYRTASGEIVITEKVTTKVETVNACQNCCLKVRKPIVVRTV